MKSVGTQLREARQVRGWTVKAAAKATKLREDQIQKIEADDFSKFHAPTYVRGFVRNYALVLGLDAPKLTEELEEVLEVESEGTYLRLSGINYVPELAKRPIEFDPRKIFLALASLVLLGILTVMGWSLYRVAKGMNLFEESPSDAVASTEKSTPKGGEPSGETKTGDQTAGSVGNTEVKRAISVDPVTPTIKAATADSPPPTPATDNATLSTAPQENKLALMAREECWVRVSVLDNNQTKVIFEDLIPAGKTEVFSPAPKYLLKARNPAALEITLNGKSYANPHASEQIPVEFSVPSSETN